MTDKEIIKVLECCGVKRTCRNCPLYEERYADCIYTVLKNALDLITRQQAEIESLKIFRGYAKKRASDYKTMRDKYLNAKSEAYKECLAKVKNYIKTHCNPYGKPDFDYDTSIKILNFIDKLAKEMEQGND